VIAVRLTFDEIELLHRLAGAALRDRKLPADIPTLRRCLKKLTVAGERILCKRCRVREKRGRSDLCARCALYRRTYGRLPSEETLIKSGAKKRRRRPANP
jgi:hypothetical protein